MDPIEFSDFIIIENNEKNANMANKTSNEEKNISNKIKLQLFAHRTNADYIIQKMIELNNPLVFTYASKNKLQNNEDFIVKALRVNYKVIKHLDNFKDLLDLEFLLSKEIDARIVELANPRIKKDPNSMKYLADINIDVLLYADESVKKSISLATKILKGQHYLDCLKYFDPSILFDVRFMEKTSEHYFEELVNLAEMYDGFNNKDFIIKMAHAAGGKFNFSILNDELKNDADFIKRLLEEDFELKFDYLGESLKNNKDFALDIFKANSKNLKLLQYFSEDIQNDWDVLIFPLKDITNSNLFMTEAIKKYREIKNYKIAHWMKDKKFVDFAMNSNRLFYIILMDHLDDDVELASNFLKDSVSLDDINRIGPKLKMQIENNGEFLLKMKEINPKLYNDYLNSRIASWKNEMDNMINENNS